MEYLPQCAVCCSTCATSLPKTPQNCVYGGLPGAPTHTQDPFALSKLLPAGSVIIKRAGQEEPALCDHKHADDGWHIFDGMHHAAYLANIEDASLCKEIGFLVKHRFIAATYNIINEDILVLRIYIIPVDLPHVHGRLHQGNRRDTILLPARRFLRNLLPRICQDHDQWLGASVAKYPQSRPIIHSPPDIRTLAEIYGDLASPQVDPSQACCDIVSRLVDYTDTLEGLGFRTSLYRYQRRSIAAMVTRELDQRLIPDPLYVTGTSMNGKYFHFQPGTMEVTIECGLVAPTRGGILCEELGTGKTVMVLGLILATLNQLPSPPETITEPTPILTPVALRAFPSTPYSSIRQQICRNEALSMNDSCPRVPSLVELMLHHARVTTNDVPPNCVTLRGIQQYEKTLEIQNRLEKTSLNDLLRENVPFYPCYPDVPLNDVARPRRGQSIQTPRIMYLSSATLVVVPPNLLSQWDREITKHCEYPLRVLILRSTTKLPPVKALATDYDIILMTYNRYTIEAGCKNISKLYSLAPCTCPNISATRVPRCGCQNVDGVSPFLQIRWKRLVIDEGHVSATLSTNLTPFTKLLGVERRWIVTGTPTTNLLGLSFGKNNIEEVVRNPESPNEGVDVWDYDWGSTCDSAPSTSDSNTSSEEHQSNPTLTSLTGRIWNKYDRGDLQKLDNMITHFIAVQHFISNPKLMQTHIREPLLDSKGPRPGAIQVLNQIMQMIMIRHQIEDVEKDIVLPPVIHESILLDLDPVVVKSYNALQATIAINAIDSQRTDQDYLFHPRNAEFLQLTVKNMSQLMFWSVDETLYNVDQLAANAKTHIERAVERKMPESDIWLIKEAFKHIKAAAEDHLWRRIQMHEDVPYRVFRMPEIIFHAWTRITELKPDYHPTLVGFLHADRLLKLRDLIMARPLSNEDIIAERGAEVVKTDYELRKAFEEAYKRNKNRHSRKYTRSLEDKNNEIMVENAAKKAAAPDTLKEMQRELDHSLARLDFEDENHLTIPGTSSDASQARPSVLIKSSVLANTLVGDSASSKLNYIINEVLNHSAKEKFLVFSDSELTLAHISEALELVQVKFLRFTTQIQPQVREQLVLTFETSEMYRVFLMELKHGARGLNLISASRVIFCEPVWQADVESQAIKRAHRIGQSRPITVKTLAIRGTAEENMVERRNLIRSGHDKLPKLTEESGMRHYIANPKFITHESDLLPIVEFPLIKIPQLPPSPSPGIPVSLHASPLPAKRVRVEEPLQENADQTASHSSKKKKKIVLFADVS